MRAATKVFNWSLLSTDALSLAEELSKSKLFDFHRFIAGALINPELGANPFHTQFAVQGVIGKVLQSKLLQLSRLNGEVTGSMVRALFRHYPILKQYYDAEIGRNHWTLAFKSKTEGFKRKDWQFQDWFFLFLKNSSPSVGSIERRFCKGSSVLRFFEELWKADDEPEYVPRVKSPNLSLAAHSTLLFDGPETTLLVDPALPAQAMRLRKYLRKADAVVYTHHHWDHFHLPTLLLLPRKTKIFVPRLQRPESIYNPSMAAFLKSLKFSCVYEISPWENFKIGEIEVFTFPFYGEWSGSGSHFDGITLGLKTRKKTLYTNVDAHEDEEGSMESCYGQIRKILGKVDYVLTSDDVNLHRAPGLWGGPFLMSSDFYVKAPRGVMNVDNEVRLRKVRSMFSGSSIHFYGDFRFQKTASFQF